MTPEAGFFLDKSFAPFRQAEAFLSLGYDDAAGRAAYLAGFHAAQALIFERDDRVVKTHKGVHAEFARLVKDDPRVDADLRSFLGRAYELKTVADYEVGPAANVTRTQAAEAIDKASIH